jgi:hypothetical protein
MKKVLDLQAKKSKQKTLLELAACSTQSNNCSSASTGGCSVKVTP